MLRFPAFGTVVLITALRLCAQEQSAPTKELPAGEAKGIPPRATPADYQAHAPAGTVTVAAEFIGHSVPTQDGSTYTTEDYVAVETGLYGPSGARLKISVEDFTLRVLAKKIPYGRIVWQSKRSRNRVPASTLAGRVGRRSRPLRYICR